MRGRRRKWTVRYLEGLVDIVRTQVLRVWQVVHGVKSDDEEGGGQEGGATQMTHFELMASLSAHLVDKVKNPHVLVGPDDLKGVEPGRGVEAHLFDTPSVKKRKSRDSWERVKRRCVVCVGLGGGGKTTVKRCSACKVPICPPPSDCFGLHRGNGSMRKGSRCGDRDARVVGKQSDVSSIWDVKRKSL